MSDSPRQLKPLKVLPSLHGRDPSPHDADLPRLLAVLADLDALRERAAATEAQLRGRNSHLQDQLDRMLETQTDLVERNLSLETELRETLRVQQELLRRHARRDAVAPSPPADQVAQLQRETAMARTLISSLESACVTNEQKLGQLRDELDVLRSILRHVDPRAIELARRKLEGRS